MSSGGEKGVIITSKSLHILINGLFTRYFQILLQFNRTLLSIIRKIFSTLCRCVYRVNIKMNICHFSTVYSKQKAAEVIVEQNAGKKFEGQSSKEPKEPGKFREKNNL